MFSVIALCSSFLYVHHHLIIRCCFVSFDSDLECTYTIICSLVKNANSPEDVLEMVKAISSKVVQQPSDKASLRLKMYDS